MSRVLTEPISLQPVRKKSVIYQLSFLICVMAGGMPSIVIKQILLPLQVGAMAPLHTALLFSLVAISGPGVGILVVPLLGALSDRQRWRHGRRKPFLLGGSVVAVIGMLIMAFAASIWVLILGEILAQMGADLILAIATAILPDQVTNEQRPRLSALCGMAPHIGGVMGLVLVTFLTDIHLIWQSYLLIGAASFICVLAFLAIFTDPAYQGEALPPLSWRSLWAEMVHPLRKRDFACVFASRCLIYFAFATVSAYLLFSLLGGLHLRQHEAQGALLHFQILATVLLVLCALGTSWLSHHKGKITTYVMVGACVMGGGLVILAANTSTSGLLVAACFFGAGMGIYVGSDIALAVAVLSGQGSARDLAIMYNAIFVALLISPLVAGLILTLSPANYTAVFTTATLACLAAALVLAPVRLETGNRNRVNTLRERHHT